MQKGFSLVELSITLAIIGMIASSAISVAISNDDYTKQYETKNKLDRIEEAIAGFVLANKRLPCPANGTTALTASTFGEEGTLTPAAGGVVCPNSNFNTGLKHMGVVPVATLQLPDDFMFDGWGRRISYAVDYEFANSQITNTTCDGTTSTVCFIHQQADEFDIKDASGTVFTTQAIYVLLSHGENGHGAFTKNGSATRINGFPAGNPYRDDSPDEMDNAEFTNAGVPTALDESFVMKDFVREDDTTDANREYFDDILRFKTKYQVVKEAGAIIYDSICQDATDIINNPGSNDCTGAAVEASCETFATEIYARCIN